MFTEYKRLQKKWTENIVVHSVHYFSCQIYPHTFRNSFGIESVSVGGNVFCKKLVMYCSLFLDVLICFVILLGNVMHTFPES